MLSNYLWQLSHCCIYILLAVPKLQKFSKIRQTELIELCTVPASVEGCFPNWWHHVNSHDIIQRFLLGCSHINMPVYPVLNISITFFPCFFLPWTWCLACLEGLEYFLALQGIHMFFFATVPNFYFKYVQLLFESVFLGQCFYFFWKLFFHYHRK